MYLAAQVRKKQGFSWFIDGKVSTVMTGRDGTENRRQHGTVVTSTISPTVNLYRPVPSRKSLRLYFTVPSRRGNIPVPSRPVGKTCPYRFVPSPKPAHTVPSRRQNLSLPSNPVVKNLSLPSRPAIHCRHSFPSGCRDRQDAVNTMNSYYSINTVSYTHLTLPTIYTV